MKEFNATNEPRTCLWCGRKLHRQCSDRWLAQALARAKRTGEVSGPLTGEQWARGYHQQFHNLFGKHDGLFCTDGCAISFGVTAARKGYRFQPREEK